MIEQVKYRKDRYKRRFADPEKRYKALIKSYDVGIKRLAELLTTSDWENPDPDDWNFVGVCVDMYESRLCVLANNTMALMGEGYKEYTAGIDDLRKELDPNDTEGLRNFIYEKVGDETRNSFFFCEGSDDLEDLD